MKHEGSCHCGRIRFEFEAEVTTAMDCNCSLCRRRGGLLAFVPASAFKLLTPAQDLGTYRFNKMHIAHHFCPNCGNAPYGEANDPKGNAMVAVNVRCVPAIDLKALKITEYDGAKL